VQKIVGDNPQDHGNEERRDLSQRPCPKGCSLSAFFDDSLTAATTITELIESESVCHASAASAIDPVAALARILNANSAEFTAIETIPSI
jgi:hypothetical protein